jgi:hypothetical protein
VEAQSELGIFRLARRHQLRERLQTWPLLQGEPYQRTAALVAKGIGGAGGCAFRTVEFANHALDGRCLTRYRQTVKWATSRPTL